MSAEHKIKLKSFLIDLVFELCIDSPIFAFAILNNKIIEFVVFYVAWKLLRYVVPHIWHFRANSPIKSLLGCAIVSIAVFLIVLRNILPINISLFVSVIISAFINEICNIVEEHRLLLKEKANNTRDIHQMSENELRNYAKSKGISKMMIETLVLRVIHNYKWCEIMDMQQYSRTAIKYHKRILQFKLNIKL